MTKTILYTDGGCSGNEQLDLSKRRMVAVVSDEHGTVLIDKRVEGGSNNIAELLAVNEALLWCVANKIGDVEIRTDSTNNLSWVRNKEVGKQINDRNAVIELKTSIDACQSQLSLSLKWIPRAQNLAGHYIEKKYQL
jgi:ribonuclease HI